MNQDFYKQTTLTDPLTEAVVAPAEIPKYIGPYKIESLLDKGGTSVLYLGLHPDTHEPLTIKVLSSQYLSHPEMIGRFMQEAKIIALTSHPNIVKLYGEGEWEGGLYIAMEFVQGISLRQLILQNSLSLKRSLEIILQIAYAISHLHAHGVIHRDLKPENILLTANGGIKVIDFGIAQLHTDTEPINGKKQLVGTPVYMSPEQKENPLRVSYPADIYSLAIVAYELVLGRLSHGIIHLSLMPQGLQKILSKALQPNVKDRYQDIVDFITDLKEYINSDALEKDLRGKDFVSQVSEDIFLAGTQLLPANLPDWPKVEIGIVNNQLGGPNALYYDFFNLKDGAWAIFLAEPSEKGARGLIGTAVLRGMIRALFLEATEPTDLMNTLNELLLKDTLDQFFVMSSLILIPGKNQLRYLSCGYGPLWHIAAGSNTVRIISADNIALGIDADTDFMEVTANWNVGDRLLLHTYRTFQEEQTQETDLQEILKDTLFLPPQKQVEALLRKILTTKNASAQSERPITLLSISRIS